MTRWLGECLTPRTVSLARGVNQMMVVVAHQGVPNSVDIIKDQELKKYLDVIKSLEATGRSRILPKEHQSEDKKKKGSQTVARALGRLR